LLNLTYIFLGLWVEIIDKLFEVTWKFLMLG
jgi:hypothetical protein